MKPLTKNLTKLAHGKITVSEAEFQIIELFYERDTISNGHPAERRTTTQR